MTESEFIRVVVVDDSAFVQVMVTKTLQVDPSIKVVGRAENGQEAIEAVKLLKPDVVTMDVEMPVLDGVGAVRAIMREQPTPIVMLSSRTSEGAEITFEALEAGAVDFFLKPSAIDPAGREAAAEELRTKVRVAAGASLHVPLAATTSGRLPSRMSFERLIVIGASTGGPPAVSAVLQGLDPNLPFAYILVQHMPEGFTESFARRLDGQSKLEVSEAAHGDRLASGKVLVAPGGNHLVVARSGVIEILPSDAVAGPSPSVDEALKSAVKIYYDRVVGVVLTGMGSDGTAGAQAVKRAGGVMIAQDEATCTIYGMPKCVAKAGLADVVAPLSRIAHKIAVVADAPSRASDLSLRAG